MPPDGTAGGGGLEDLVERLERTAAQLRAGDLEPARAATLVDDCARLAADAGARLDAELRAAEAGPPSPGQLRLAP
jgi:hypothetical protein